MNLHKTAKDFENLACAGYKNICDIEKNSERLHSAETLFGDHSAKILIFLQDSANYEVFENLKAKGLFDVFRHDPTRKTNKKLVEIFSPKFPVDNVGSNSKNCGLFCANIVWLLKAGSMSAPISDKKVVLDVCRPVFLETINGLKNLKLIIAFGRVTYESLQYYFDFKSDWADDVKNRTIHKLPNGLHVAASVHPAAWGNVREKHSNGEEQPWLKDVEVWLNLINAS